MLWIFSVVILLLSLIPCSSATEITSIETDVDEIYVSTGSRLLIPCNFYVDGPIQKSNIILQWGKGSGDGGLYTPVIHLTDSTTVLREQPHDMRVQLFVSRVHQGNCSLVIGPIKEDDQGIYELHLEIDGFKYKPIPKVRILVRDKDQDSGNHAKKMDTPRSRSLVNDEADYNTQATTMYQEDSTYPVIANIQTLAEENVEYELVSDGEILPTRTQHHPQDGSWLDLLLYTLSKSGQITYIAIPAAICLVVVIAACIGGCFIGIRWYNCCVRPEDEYRAMEEGRPVLNLAGLDPSPSVVVSVSPGMTPPVIHMPAPSTAPASCPSYIITIDPAGDRFFRDPDQRTLTAALQL